jgi:hypothetical protein
MKERLSAIERGADVIIQSPLTGHLHRVPFVRFGKIGIPSPHPGSNDEAATDRDLSGPSDQPLRALHCPSYPELKGTPLIELAIANLRARGIVIELTQVTGVPNEEVQRLIDQTDFVIDQTYSDTPMGTFALEAARHGKAAVVAGFEMPVYFADNPEDDMPPSIVCRPAELEMTLENICRDPTILQTVGRAARQKSKSWAGPHAVISRLQQAIQEVPDEWTYDPQKLEAHWGAGVTPLEVTLMVSALVTQFGPDALCLNHNPGLLEQFLANAVYRGEEEWPPDNIPDFDLAAALTTVQDRIRAVTAEIERARHKLDDFQEMRARRQKKLQKRQPRESGIGVT